ncbi:HPr kinase/phosphatase C-terminal domain-containing protein [Novosphingobium sp. 1949]|uniref:HPr kinase/phosphatase C-terminal domain-containing protein n=1 Tax=Novosphingobium organovorum TaxID=2930092 RepID=A0ABT0B838_9SPHN|nr:HPr kinase/phosphatase C-terminal domain-containing protein [Novosphingobium organovorum]MCJ2181236.1 HPr kinase/phosphatase C-terminal domain-containing protein [Novosphingobium organovorum]
MNAPSPLAYQATAVAIAGRAVLIEGAPGSGKTSLALELIDRGARLIGDDGLHLVREADRLIARPHPNTRGLIEVRNLGVLATPFCERAPVCLVLRLDENAPRFVEGPAPIERGGIALPSLALWPRSGPLAIKAELALATYGLAL